MFIPFIIVLFELAYTYTSLSNLINDTRLNKLINDAKLVEIVSHSRNLYFSIFNNEFRISSPDKIKRNHGCSKFVVYNDNTAIIQGKERLCKSSLADDINVCGTMDANTWEIVRYEQYVKFKYPGQNKCITATQTFGLNGREANLQECVNDSTRRDVSQRFVMKNLYLDPTSLNANNIEKQMINLINDGNTSNGAS
ncbi:hypothetical protein CWI42_091900 [Ordospora colligata]|uniref:Ricin B lectin domain-containing protein n=1 Tax=Ordospora colligata OC4 TaxID=1354746 RepID=A0A0B2UJR5_9MICR|nr:uncharacterized protein M896_091920 [Ordospora colligata OC4]KHN69262.1 hypothetical protein M896_091920 [Ordospora colligata OC4]TBU14440.1 hypothetical protein CWI40_091910 [Ordospora colligata]TBU14717.1 hypothetical protein CWI41_091920 [Ordospora colligata]TBU18102.1 hypothetical protein CWI42_091900 [Ordospora colligata]